MTEYEKALPLVSEPLNAPYWEGAKRHELLLRKCEECGEFQWPPRPMCSKCHSFEFEWVQAKGTGTLYSYTIANRPWHIGFVNETPYAVVVVELDEGIRMLGNSEGVKPEDLRIGMSMEVAFNDATEEVTLVNWKPAASER